MVGNKTTESQTIEIQDSYSYNIYSYLDYANITSLFSMPIFGVMVHKQGLGRALDPRANGASLCKLTE